MESEIVLINNETIIGKFALDLLSGSKIGKIWGITSRGLFINLQGSIVFLTNTRYLGPVNIIANLPLIEQWKNEDELEINMSDQTINFDHSKYPVSIKIKKIWKTPPKPVLNMSDEEQQKRILAAARQLSFLKNEQGYAPLLMPFVSDTLYLETDNTWLFSSWNTIKLLRISMSLKNIESILSLANLLVGSGRGLTPSGDDLLTGLTFIRRRWFPEVNWMTEVEDQLLATFKIKTTSVSSTLFECAMQGEADARIQEMADVLMSADTPFQQQALELSRWGNSSGADVFLGMILAIESFQNYV
ncbi:MAG: hypothetical protein CVU41_08595 [Chloroflexi bacterium HGW-Chloroflexi-3]|nr:MAG: hypothetical protein CVU41_08595 [Chloroflexi bacterium HGW-Chloroflexi-3]